ncbi:pinensin family lanthipeptide [Longimicrobium sp.]|uniref:pinensin family lanthipeptide n=1 Tax=Longimicrobium sp. TaxID=2029185 RepID=UPI002E32108F|nr:pinensin family lanthipeptide [Longimicrobium sp.]HEX6042009.1 pinensin family lanthipeptide [Longimicrobium sp.]
MKKLKLDDLQVNSFATTPQQTAALRGTVRGHLDVVISGTGACDFHTWTDNVQTNDCNYESMNCP